MNDNPLGFCFLDFPSVSGHFVTLFEAIDVDLIGLQPRGGPRNIHSYVATAYNDHGFTFERDTVGLTNGFEKSQTALDAGKIDTLTWKPFLHARAGRNEDGIGR